MNDDLGQLSQNTANSIQPPVQEDAAAHDNDGQDLFLSSMGHELRNPLTSIIAYAEALQEGVYGPLQDTQRNALAAIQKDVRQMLHLVADVVDLCRATPVVSPGQPAACLLDEICQLCLERVADLAGSRSARILCEIHPPNLTVLADEPKLRQLITELISAALLTMPSGGQLRLHLSAAPAGLCLQTSDATARPATAQESLSVTNALGSPLLNRLKKLKPIGIALLQKLVRLHEGSYTVSESAGHAVSMCIHLPLEILPSATQEPPVAAPAADSHQAASAPRQPKTILIADDQASLITVTRNYLESLGFQVITAGDGQEAVHQAFTRRPDLIIMDVRMPVLDGLSAIRQIRESPDPQIRAVTIISLSGLSGIADKEKCLAAGATFYLNKPFGVREIDRVIADYLQSPAN